MIICITKLNKKI